MDIKYFLITILSGIAGMLAMTVIMYLYTFLSHHFTKVIHILGNILVGERNYCSPSGNALIVVIVMHFGVGVLFSFSYFLLWKSGVFQINFQDSVLIGFISGVLANGGWKAYLSLHSTPPKFSQLHFFLTLFLTPIVFAVVTVNTVQLVTDNPELWYQVQENARLSQ